MTIRTITGTIEYANGSIPENSRAEFYLNGIHIDAVTVAHSAVFAVLDNTGDITVDLYPNDVGYGANRYNVDLVTYSDSEYTKEVRRVNLGKIYVEDVDGQILQDLLALFIGPSEPLTVAEEASQDAIAASGIAVTARDEAVAARDQAVLYDGIWLEDFTELFGGGILTYTIGNPGTVASGDIVRTRKEGGSYIVVASGSTDYDITHDAVKMQVYTSPAMTLASFGMVGDGVTDDTAAFSKAIASAGAARVGLIGDGTKTYLVNTTVLIEGSTNTVPLFINFSGAKIKAKAGFTGDAVIKCINPHADFYGFRLCNVEIDTNAASHGGGECDHGLYIKGSQHAFYENIRVLGAASDGVLIKGETGYGIYYNTFTNVTSGVPSTQGYGCGGYGFKVIGITQRFANNNTFIACKSAQNLFGGVYVERATGNSFYGCSVEDNSGPAYTIGEAAAGVTIVGGYTESNMVTGVDTCMSISTATSVTNILMQGGRFNGVTSGVTTIPGLFVSDTNGDDTTWNTDLVVNDITGATGTVDGLFQAGDGSFRVNTPTTITSLSSGGTSAVSLQSNATYLVKARQITGTNTTHSHSVWVDTRNDGDVVSIADHTVVGSKARVEIVNVSGDLFVKNNNASAIDIMYNVVRIC